MGAPRVEKRSAQTSQATPSRAARPRSPIVGAALSFLFPGLGELYAGARVRAAVFGLPVIAALAWLLVRALGGLTRLAFDLFDPSFAAGLFAVVAVTGLLRLASILDTYLVLSVRRASGRLSSVLLLAFLAATVAVHGFAGWYVASFWSASGHIFVGDQGNGTDPGGVAGASAAPGATSNPFTGQLHPPADPSSRVNILLLGADSGLGYDHALTDTQILVSIDPVGKKVLMASLPRDIAQLPMYNGGTYPGKINSLMTAAAADPARYPDGGVGTLAKEVGYLLGVNVNYYAFVNLAGFAKLIDVVGGVDVVNPTDIVDPGYGFPDGKTGFFLKAGPQHLNSRIGLAYVRTRQGVGDNDYTRARRQQLVLQALRQKLISPSVLPKVPELLNALAQTIRTDFPVSRVADMVTLAQEIPDASVDKYVLGPPYARNPPLSATGGVWLLRLDMKVVKAWSVRVFGTDSAYYIAPTASPSGQP